jgi:pyruvate,water dikinase
MEDIIKEAIDSAKKGTEEEKDKGYVKWLFELSKKDSDIGGGKGAFLAELYNNKFPVPPAFIITVQAFEKFTERISRRINEILEITDLKKTEELIENSKKIRSIIEAEDFPKDMEKEILEAYEILGTESKDTKVSGDAMNILRIAKEPVFAAVRSSPQGVLEQASFPGQQETYINVKGNSRILHAVKKCFSSLYTPRAIYYRKNKEIKGSTAVVVQKMINSEKSGAVFTKSPFGEEMLIEAVFGLGEGLVSGRICPDNYTINEELEIQDKKTGEKEKAITRNAAGENEEISLTEERSTQQVLTDGQVKELANLALRIKNHLKKPQEIEFAIENGDVFVVQSRPLTTPKNKTKKITQTNGDILLSGRAASSGVVSGKVKIIKPGKETEEVKKGEVLAAENLSPEFFIAALNSEAVISNHGGISSSLAAACRELEIPCITGAKNAASILKEGQEITVDGNSGKVFHGKSEQEKEVMPVTKTKTEIMITLDAPEHAKTAALSKCNSVGLLKVESIIGASGKHPLHFIKEKRTEAYKELLAKELSKIAEHFDSLWIRTSDIQSDEYRNLEGAPEVERNPILGNHGIRFSLKNKSILQAELQAIRKIAEKYPIKKIGVMFPQVISVEEATQARRELAKVRTENMEVGMMIETPSSVQIIQELCDTDINFVSIGTNDLTQYTLALDKNNPDVSELYDELHPSIFRQIESVISACKRNGVKTSVCGRAVSRQEMIEFLVEKGIDSISVNAEHAYQASEIVKKTEERLEKQIKKEGEGIQALTQEIDEGIEVPEPVEEEEEEEITTQESKKEEYVESQMAAGKEPEKTMVQESTIIKKPIPQTIEIIPDSFYTPQFRNIQNLIDGKVEQIRTGKIEKVNIPETVVEKAQAIISQDAEMEKQDIDRVEQEINELEGKIKYERDEDKRKLEKVPEPEVRKQDINTVEQEIKELENQLKKEKAEEEQEMTKLEEQGHKVLDIF